MENTVKFANILIECLKSMWPNLFTVYKQMHVLILIQIIHKFLRWKLLLKLQGWNAKKSVHICCLFLLCLSCFPSQDFSWRTGRLLGAGWARKIFLDLEKLNIYTSSIPTKTRGWSLVPAAVWEVLRVSCTCIKSPPGCCTAAVLVLDLCRGHRTAGAASLGSSNLLWSLMPFGRCWVSRVWWHPAAEWGTGAFPQPGTMLAARGVAKQALGQLPVSY